MVLTGVTGICLTTDCSYAEKPEVNRSIAVTILVFILVCLATSVVDLVILWKYSKYFGVRLLTRGQYQISPIDGPARDVYSEPGRTVTPMVGQTNATPQHQLHHHHHTDPRLASPPRDFSTQHLQHYLTEQYKTRIRKRNKRKRRRNAVEPTNGSNGEMSRKQRERQAPYVLPPVIAPRSQFPPICQLKRRAPPPPRPDTPEPPSPVSVYPPPSPSPPPAPSLGKPPNYSNFPSSMSAPDFPTLASYPVHSETPPPPSTPIVAFETTLPGPSNNPQQLQTTSPYNSSPLTGQSSSESGASQRSGTPSGGSYSPPMYTEYAGHTPPPQPPSPGDSHPSIIHVIPYGAMSEDEEEDENLPPYSP